VHLPPSKGRGQGNSAYAPHHPHQYHSPSYSPGYLFYITLLRVLSATSAPAMPLKKNIKHAPLDILSTNMLSLAVLKHACCYHEVLNHERFETSHTNE
jgi:hypothetical protein